MRIYTKAEYEQNKEEIIRQIQEGAVFIYPTDTIYGLGCDATNETAVARVRELKKQNDRPFSIIVSDKDWILEHCDLDTLENEWVQKLPGPYTIILTLKNIDSIAANVTFGDTVGVRIPAIFTSELAALSEVPIISTSANIMGEDFMTSVENLNPEIKNHVDFIIDVGVIDGKPSTIVDLTGSDVKVIRR